MRITMAAFLAGSVLASPALAALQTGVTAPDFSAVATQGGNEFSFHLADALKKGPVVLYFYPAAALHTTVIGVSMDGIEKLKKFSISECRSKFPVASDKSGAISHEYDAVLIGMLGYASRTSYVIAPTGQVIYAYNAMDPTGHVANTMKAVQTWESTHPAP
jgi:peroxiredoxin